MSGRVGGKVLEQVQALVQKNWDENIGGKAHEGEMVSLRRQPFFSFMKDYLWLQDPNNNTAASITEKNNVSTSYPLVNLEIPS